MTSWGMVPNVCTALHMLAGQLPQIATSMGQVLDYKTSLISAREESCGCRGGGEA